MNLVAASTQKCFEMLTPPPDENTSISMNDCNYIQFRGVNYFFEIFGTGSCIFQNQWRQGTGDVEGVRSFHVTAPVGCFRTEPRFSRSGLIVARGAPCIQTCTFRSPKLFMQLINCFNIESCERGTVTDMALSEDSFCQLNLDFQVILSSQKGGISTV